MKSNEIICDFTESGISLDAIQSEYIRLSPDVEAIRAFKNDNNLEAKSDFLNNESLRKPNNQYDNSGLDLVDKNINDLIDLGEATKNSSVNSKLKSIYIDQIDSNLQVYSFYKAMIDYRQANSVEIKNQTAKEFMALNASIYGEPDELTYRSLLYDKFNQINVSKLDSDAQCVYRNLQSEISPIDTHVRAFWPQPQTVDFMQKTVESLYCNLLEAVPQKDMFSIKEVTDVFRDILDNRFGLVDDKDKWQVILDDSHKNITVSNEEKKVFMPTDRSDMKREALVGLIVHEIGTHIMREVIGEESGVGLLSLGASGYLDSEEGIARVFEEAINGKYKKAGVDHYITTGLAYFDLKDFRQIFDVKWQLGALIKASKTETGSITDAIKTAAINTAYKETQRNLRGTDELPRFKDLAYYNGSVKVWQYVESHIDDPQLIDNLLLNGKINLFDHGQAQIAYEAHVGGFSS
jgi:hypothetical protein